MALSPRPPAATPSKAPTNVASVQVVARFRPFNEMERQLGAPPCVQFPSDKAVTVDVSQVLA